MKFLVDVHEPEECALTLLEIGCQVERRALAVGDYETSECLYERKEIRDLAASIIDGRLWSQLYRMSKTDKVCFLIVHGNIFDVQPSMRKPVLGAVSSAAVRYGVHVIWTPTLKLALYLLASTAYKVHEGKYGVPHVLRNRVRHRDQRVEALSKMLGVPIQVSERLIEKFGNIKNVAEASVEELMTVKGIGEIRAKRIHSLFNR